MLNTDLISEIKDKVSNILASTHNIAEKRKFHTLSNHLEMACPYCGDSSHKSNEKRGYLYFDSCKYFCHKCKTTKQLITFFSDFNLPIDNIDHRLEIRNVTSEYFLKSKKDLEVFNVSLIEEVCPKIETIVNTLYLKPTNEETPFIKSRYLKNQTKNIYIKGDNIYIFNIYKGYVLGYQIRNEKYENKYVKYSLKTIYEKILKKEVTESVTSLNKISLFYGFFQTDYNSKFTIFESSLDSFLFPNSIGVSSVNSDISLFEDLQNCRFFYDNDDVGIKKARQLIKDNKSVFLWKKFLEDYNLEYEKIKDYGDILKYSIENKLKLHKVLENYFSTNSLQILFL